VACSGENGRAAEFVDYGDADAYRKLSARMENPSKPMDGSRLKENINQRKWKRDYWSRASRTGAASAFSSP
jgi:hypothetical protein